jgi:hypothetical protein
MNELYNKLLGMRKHPTILLDLDEIKLFRLDQRQHLTFRERLNPVSQMTADRYRFELLNYGSEQLIRNYQNVMLRAVLKVFGRLNPESHSRPVDIFTLCKLTEVAAAEAIPKPKREAPGKLREIYSLLQPCGNLKCPKAKGHNSGWKCINFSDGGQKKSADFICFKMAAFHALK